MMQQSYTPTQVYFRLFDEPSAQYEGGDRAVLGTT